MNAISKDENGRLIKYAWPGGYPVAHLDKCGNVCCADCANRDVDALQEIVASFINWEDENLFCDDCGQRIESAYSED